MASVDVRDSSGAGRTHLLAELEAIATSTELEDQISALNASIERLFGVQGNVADTEGLREARLQLQQLKRAVARATHAVQHQPPPPAQQSFRQDPQRLHCNKSASGHTSPTGHVTSQMRRAHSAAQSVANSGAHRASAHEAHRTQTPLQYSRNAASHASPETKMTPSSWHSGKAAAQGITPSVEQITDALGALLRTLPESGASSVHSNPLHTPTPGASIGAEHLVSLQPVPRDPGAASEGRGAERGLDRAALQSIISTLRVLVHTTHASRQPHADGQLHACTPNPSFRVPAQSATPEASDGGTPRHVAARGGVPLHGDTPPHNSACTSGELRARTTCPSFTSVSASSATPEAHIGGTPPHTAAHVDIPMHKASRASGELRAYTPCSSFVSVSAPSATQEAQAGTATCSASRASFADGCKRQVSFQGQRRVSEEAAGAKQNRTSHPRAGHEPTGAQSPRLQASRAAAAAPPAKHPSADAGVRQRVRGASLMSPKQPSPNSRRSLPADDPRVSPRLLQPSAAHGSLAGQVASLGKSGCVQRALPGSPPAAAWVPPGRHNSTFSSVGATRVRSRSLSRVGTSLRHSLNPASPGSHNVHRDQHCGWLGAGTKPGSPTHSPANDTVYGFRQRLRDPASGLTLPRQPLPAPASQKHGAIYGPDGRPWPISGTSRPASARLSRARASSQPFSRRPYSACATRGAKVRSPHGMHAEKPGAPSSPQDEARTRLKLDAMYADSCGGTGLVWDGRKSLRRGPTSIASQSRSRSAPVRDVLSPVARPHSQPVLSACLSPRGGYPAGAGLVEAGGGAAAAPQKPPSRRAWGDGAAEMDSEDAKLGGSGTAVGPGILGAGEFGGCQASEASGQGCQVQEADTVDMDELSDLQAAMDSFSKILAEPLSSDAPEEAWNVPRPSPQGFHSAPAARAMPALPPPEMRGGQLQPVSVCPGVESLSQRSCAEHAQLQPVSVGPSLESPSQHHDLRSCCQCAQPGPFDHFVSHQSSGPAATGATKNLQAARLGSGMMHPEDMRVGQLQEVAVGELRRNFGVSQHEIPVGQLQEVSVGNQQEIQVGQLHEVPSGNFHGGFVGDQPEMPVGQLQEIPIGDPQEDPKRASGTGHHSSRSALLHCGHLQAVPICERYDAPLPRSSPSQSPLHIRTNNNVPRLNLGAANRAHSDDKRAWEEPQEARGGHISQNVLHLSLGAARMAHNNDKQAWEDLQEPCVDLGHAGELSRLAERVLDCQYDDVEASADCGDGSTDRRCRHDSRPAVMQQANDGVLNSNAPAVGQRAPPVCEHAKRPLWQSPFISQPEPISSRACPRGWEGASAVSSRLSSSWQFPSDCRHSQGYSPPTPREHGTFTEEALRDIPIVGTEPLPARPPTRRGLRGGSPHSPGSDWLQSSMGSNPAWAAIQHGQQASMGSPSQHGPGALQHDSLHTGAQFPSPRSRRQTLLSPATRPASGQLVTPTHASMDLVTQAQLSLHLDRASALIESVSMHARKLQSAVDAGQLPPSPQRVQQPAGAVGKQALTQRNSQRRHSGASSGSGGPNERPGAAGSHGDCAATPLDRLNAIHSASGGQSEAQPQPEKATPYGPAASFAKDSTPISDETVDTPRRGPTRQSSAAGRGGIAQGAADVRSFNGRQAAAKASSSGQLRPAAVTPTLLGQLAPPEQQESCVRRIGTAARRLGAAGSIRERIDKFESSLEGLRTVHLQRLGTLGSMTGRIDKFQSSLDGLRTVHLQAMQSSAIAAYTMRASIEPPLK